MRLLLLFFTAILSAQPVAREMSLVTPDGFILKGTLSVPIMAGPRPVVILAHQFRAYRDGWKVLTADLNARGIATLALDLRGHGAGRTRPFAPPHRDYRDQRRRG